MYLKSIIINGFKSFPDKKEFKIEGGITGVVGPNGSGKSNVADAVRWVLGEQSAKSLRGGKMLDVIFGGSDSRKPRSFCEVSLIFDNSAAVLDTDFSEVHISRKLYRSGESEYTINKASCRLKDILDMFRDTGIGKEGYSIIGQGKIDEILTEKSTERRKIFEEAAGIMKYRVRKEEAERKLARTQENLVRVKDILGELEHQIGPLKKQSEQAKRYVALADRLKVLEVNLYLEAYDKHAEKIDAVQKTIDGLAEEEQGLLAQIKALEATMQGEEQMSTEMDEKIAKMNYDVTACQRDIERIDGEIRLNNERKAYFERDIDRLNAEIETENEGIKQNEFAAQVLAAEIEKTETEQSEADARIFEMQNRLAEKHIQQEQENRILSDVKSGVFDNLGELTEIKTGLSAAVTERDSAKRRVAEIKQRLESYTSEIAALKADEHAQQQAMEEAETESNDLKTKVFDLAREYRERESELSKATAELYDLEKQLEGISSRKKLLTEMRDGFDGYYNSVKNLMLAAEKDSGISNKIIATVAQAITVPEEYEVAVDVALGNATQNIIVENEYDAKALIEFLKKHEMGRVSFLPLDALKTRTLSAGEQRYLSEKGVIGVASDLVSFDKRVKEAVDYLLARTVLVDNMDNAIRIMKQASYSFRIVTLEGEVLNPGGVITGGSVKKNQGGLISRERVLGELAEEETEKSKLADNIRAKFVILRESLKSIADQRDMLDAQQRKAELTMTAAAEKLNALKDKRSTHHVAVDTLSEELGMLTQELESSEYKASELKDMEVLLTGTGDETNEKIRQLEEKFNALTAEIEQLKDTLSKEKIRFAERKKDQDAKRNELKRLEKEALYAKGMVDKRLKLIEACKTGISDNEAGAVELHKQLADKREESKALQEKVNNSLVMRQDLRGQVRAKLDEKEKLHESLSELSEKKHKAELNIAKIESNFEFSQNTIWDKYQLTYVNALKFKEEIVLSEANREIDEIKSKIRSMGDVNPHAIEDYENASTRFNNLTTQKDDLDKASDDLEKVISGLMDKMKESFEEKFQEISKNFKEVFKELFGGGHVNLVLEDKTNIMESGIQIVAEPPGKHLQNIMLLSGGEKALTAIALLFALLKINPSPLCILDEIDAALDDANVNKFAEYLRKFNNETQFIVITHRKPTMAIADVLYGLAMEEKGVTEVLSVNIS